MIDDLNFDEMPLPSVNKSHDITAMKGVKFNDDECPTVIDHSFLNSPQDANENGKLLPMIASSLREQVLRSKSNFTQIKEEIELNDTNENVHERSKTSLDLLQNSYSNKSLSRSKNIALYIKNKVDDINA